MIDSEALGTILTQLSALIFAACAVAGFVGGCVIGQFAKATRLALLGYIALGFVGSGLASFAGAKIGWWPIGWSPNLEIAAAIVGGFFLPYVGLTLSNRPSTSAK